MGSGAALGPDTVPGSFLVLSLHPVHKLCPYLGCSRFSVNYQGVH